MKQHHTNDENTGFGIHVGTDILRPTQKPKSFGVAKRLLLKKIKKVSIVQSVILI